MCCLVGTDKIELPKGWGIFINSGILHRFEAQCSTFTPNIVFSPALLAPEQSLIYEKYISPVINSQVPYEILNPNTPWNHHILELLSQIFPFRKHNTTISFIPFNSCSFWTPCQTICIRSCTTIVFSRISSNFMSTIICSLWGKYLGNWFPIREANSGLPNCFYIDLHS